MKMSIEQVYKGCLSVEACPIDPQLVAFFHLVFVSAQRGQTRDFILLEASCACFLNIVAVGMDAIYNSRQ